MVVLAVGNVKCKCRTFVNVEDFRSANRENDVLNSLNLTVEVINLVFTLGKLGIRVYQGIHT